MVDQSKPIGGTDFITRPSPHGLGMRFYAQTDDSVAGFIAIDEAKQGPPGHAHGGSLIALLDEAMGASAWYQGYRCVAVNLQFDLRRGVPLDTNVTVRGWVESKEGRKIWCGSEILLADGNIAVSGRGLFLEAPDYVGNDEDFNPFTPLEET